MECERTSGQRSRQPRQHSRRLRPRGANCGHCPVRRSVACGHTGLQRCRGSASNHGGCAVQRPPGRCSGPQPLSGREAAPGGTLTSSPTSVPGNRPARASYRITACWRAAYLYAAPARPRTAAASAALCSPAVHTLRYIGTQDMCIVIVNVVVLYCIVLFLNEL